MTLRRPIVLVDGGLRELADGDEATGSVLLVIDDAEPENPRLKTYWLRPSDGAYFVRVPSSGGAAWFQLSAPLPNDLISQPMLDAALAAYTNTTDLTALLADKVDSSALGVTVATLDGGGKVPSSQLPSYVDDVLEFANLAAFPGT